MSKPYIHAQSSAKKFGGKPEDYIDIHTFMDSSKGAIADNRHRALTHNAWFIMNILERVRFRNSYVHSPDQLTYPTIVVTGGKQVSIRDVGEQHILEDFKNRFIPTAQDYIGEIEFKPWMQNGDGVPPSYQKVVKKKVRPEDSVMDGSRRPIQLPPIVPPNPVVWPPLVIPPFPTQPKPWDWDEDTFPKIRD